MSSSREGSLRIDMRRSREIVDACRRTQLPRCVTVWPTRRRNRSSREPTELPVFAWLRALPRVNKLQHYGISLRFGDQLHLQYRQRGMARAAARGSLQLRRAGRPTDAAGDKKAPQQRIVSFSSGPDWNAEGISEHADNLLMPAIPTRIA